MRHFALLLALFALVTLTAACGDYANTVRKDVSVPQSNGPNPQNLPNPNTVPKPNTPQGYAVSPSPVTIEEVLVDPIGPRAGNQYVELFNASLYEADIGGWILTDGIHSHTFGYGFRVAPGARVLVHVGTAGIDTQADQFAPSFSVLQDAGSLALLRNGTELVDFVQWGADGQLFEVSAEQVGEWLSGDFVNLPTQGQSFHYDGTANDSSAWHHGNVSPGQ